LLVFVGAVSTVRPSFRDPRFVLLLTGETVNSVGGWASAIVLWGFAAYRFNASPYAVSVTVMCWAAPSAVLSPLMAVYVDRLGPKRALVVGYVAAAAAALGMAAAGSLVQLDVAAVAYGIPPSQFALFEAAAGTGAILAGLVISRLGARIGGLAMLSASAIGYGLAACAFIGTTSIPIAYAGAFTWGITGALFSAVALTTLQQVAPVHAHGRIMGVAGTIQSAADTAGQPLAGVTLAAIGIRAGALSLAGVTIATGTIFLTAASISRSPSWFARSGAGDRWRNRRA
jgi:MFS family permease